MVYLVMEANPREKASMYQNLKFYSEITDDECLFFPRTCRRTLHYIILRRKGVYFLDYRRKGKKRSLDDLYNP
jgi:hypothetical protein